MRALQHGLARRPLLARRLGVVALERVVEVGRRGRPRQRRQRDHRRGLRRRRPGGAVARAAGHLRAGPADRAAHRLAVADRGRPAVAGAVVGQRRAREVGGRLGLGRRGRRRVRRRRRGRAHRDLVRDGLGRGLRLGRWRRGRRRRHGHGHLGRRPLARLRLAAMPGAAEAAEQRRVRRDADQQQQRQAPPAGRRLVLLERDLAGHVLHLELRRDRAGGGRGRVVIGRVGRVVVRGELGCERGGHVVTVRSPRPAKRGEG